MLPWHRGCVVALHVGDLQQARLKYYAVVKFFSSEEENMYDHLGSAGSKGP